MKKGNREIKIPDEVWEQIRKDEEEFSDKEAKKEIDKLEKEWAYEEYLDNGWDRIELQANTSYNERQEFDSRMRNLADWQEDIRNNFIDWRFRYFIYGLRKYTYERCRAKFPRDKA